MMFPFRYRAQPFGWKPPLRRRIEQRRPPAALSSDVSRFTDPATMKQGLLPFIRLLLACSLLFDLLGCTPSANPSLSESNVRPLGAVLPTSSAAPNDRGASASPLDSCTMPALIALWQQRANTPVRDLPIGPGDVITVSVPEIEELQNQKVRVSPRGQIELPLIGRVRAAGLAESALHRALIRRLAVYMKHPRVELFVDSYRSRSVAVMGAVQKPGYYEMADSRESLLAMVGLAGGLSADAAQTMVFSPVGTSQPISYASQPDRLELVSGRPTPLQPTHAGGSRLAASPEQSALFASEHAAAGSPDAAPDHQSIVLNLGAAGDAGCLEMPARPGDVLIVPVAGEVMVQGWVRNPGAFKITPGMTILGAVSAAGGPLFSWWAELLRTDGSGERTIKHYSLPQLESGQQPDPLVQSGDVIVLEKTMLGAVPYAFYSLFGHFGTGLALPLF